jgi:hypothetical protein
MTPEDYKRCAELLRDPDYEDCERVASGYGNHLLDVARSTTAALRDLLALIESVAPEYAESTVASDARITLAEAEA